ncbi:MAG TPA: phosphoribosylformylglycinamidine cyclo-ligase [Actinomycetota bacterium]|nr:phosphoribosylformylglycinamidine cyclo-ligase [Actinomycetota bacterium]
MSEAYRRAGVDLDAAAKAVSMIADLAAKASRPEAQDAVGGFAGLFDLGDGRHLVAATDGVGTKTEIARETGRLDTVGIDLVAMCADDVVCMGAEPLFFLDYLAVGKVVPQRVAALVEGVAEGCRRAGCALLGGETAEHPGVMPEDQFDLAGFCVGIVDDDKRIGPDHAQDGDVLVGLASSGLHSNGYSLVRDVIARAGVELDDHPEELGGRSLADELLEPTAIYAPLVARLARDGRIHAAAHVTGGGIPENLPRALPEGLGADVDPTAWTAPPVFGFLQGAGGIADADLRSTFNLGIGMILVVPTGGATDVVAAARSAGHDANVVGRVASPAGIRWRSVPL